MKKKVQVILELIADMEQCRVRYKQFWEEDGFHYEVDDPHTGDVVMRRNLNRELENWRGVYAKLYLEKNEKTQNDEQLKKAFVSNTNHLYSKILDWNSFGYFETTPSAELEKTIVLMQQRISNLEAEKATMKEELKTALREVKGYRDKESSTPTPQPQQPPRPEFKGVA